jgi:Dolichyl-phosphate-mannose-protein mannosyltransferase
MSPNSRSIGGSYKVLIHAGLIILLSICISLIFPLFFRADDVWLMHWGANHNLKEIFSVNSEHPGGAYRPVYFYFFSILYRLFDLNPLGYQIVCTAIFLFVFYLLYSLCEMYFGKACAVVTLIIYCAIFYNHFQMAFWFTDVCFSMHLMFAFMAIIFYMKGKESRYYIALSYLCALMGALTKEPSIIIVISFVFADLLVRSPRREYLRSARVLLPYVAIAAWLFISSGVVNDRFQAQTDATALLDRLNYRYTYYFEFLLSGTKRIIPILLAASMAMSISGTVWARIAIMLLCIPCYFSVYYYIMFMFATTGLFVFRDRKLLPFFLWMLPTSLMLPFMTFITPTYLFEFSFGFAIVLGYITSKHLISRIYHRLHSSRIFDRAVLIVVSLLVIGAFAQPAISQVNALQLVVESRRNLSEGIGFIEKNRDAIKYIIVPDQEINDSVEDISKWAIQSNSEKAKSQKTMSWENIEQYLSLLKLYDIRVLPYSQYVLDPVTGPKVVLILQNEADIRFAAEKGLIDRELFSYSHRNTNRLMIASVR